MSPVNDQGQYFEDENFVPDPTAYKGTLATHGRSGHMDRTAVSDVFLDDRRKVAQEIVDGERDVDFDPEGEEETSAEDREAALKEKAQEFLEETEENPRLSDSQRAAAQESDDDASTESKASETTSVADAGGTEPTKTSQAKADATKSTGSKSTAKSTSKSSTAKK